MGCFVCTVQSRDRTFELMGSPRDQLQPLGSRNDSGSHHLKEKHSPLSHTVLMPAPMAFFGLLCSTRTLDGDDAMPYRLTLPQRVGSGDRFIIKGIHDPRSSSRCRLPGCCRRSHTRDKPHSTSSLVMIRIFIGCSIVPSDK